jgi:hypothetical protein
VSMPMMASRASSVSMGVTGFTALCFHLGARCRDVDLNRWGGVFLCPALDAFHQVLKILIPTLSAPRLRSLRI